MTRNEEAEPQAGAPVGPPVQIVGIGADGWSGLGAAAREALEAARVVLGSPRQLDLLPAHVTAERVAWPSPLHPAVAPLLVQHASCGLAVLASGDPMHFGIGRLLTDTLRATADDAQWIVHPSPSSMSLACARLGWPVEDVEVVSAVGRDVRTLNARLAPERRILVLSADGDTPGEVAALLRDGGYGPTRMRVLGDLGSPQESLVEARAAHWPATPAPRLNIVALECVPDDSDDLNDPDDSVDDRHGRSLDSRDGDAFDPRAWPGLVPGLPDTRYETDGQLTKWEVRAVTLAALAPAPGELLWDVGGGSGSIGIEWMRAHPSCRAVTVEARADRAAVIEANAGRLGVPGLRVVVGAAPDSLADLATDRERPDAVFIGGGLTTPGLVQACWDALRPGGRLVANTVTIESEALLVDLRARLGGRLTRLEVSRAEPIGGYLGWRPARPVTQWSTRKPAPPTRSAHDVRMSS